MTERDTSRGEHKKGDISGARRPKKKYEPPKLIEYGSTSKLSAAKPGTTSDGANSILMSCL